MHPITGTITLQKSKWFSTMHVLGKIMVQLTPTLRIKSLTMFRAITLDAGDRGAWYSPEIIRQIVIGMYANM